MIQSARPFSIGFFVLCVVFGSFESAFAKKRYLNGSTLHFPKKLIDFGDMHAGEVKSYQFQYENRGKDDVHINGVHAACGCTGIKLSKANLKPGEKGELNVKFESGGFDGLVIKTIAVVSDDPVLPSQILTIKANVKNSIWLEPSAIDFGDVSFGQKRQKVVSFKSLESLNTMSTPELVFEKNKFNVEFVQSLEGSKPTGIRLEWNANKVGKNLDTIQLNFGPKVLKLPIRADVKAIAGWSPEYIEFGSVKKQKLKERTVSLHDLKDLKPEMIDFELRINGELTKYPQHFIEYKIIQTKNDNYQFKIKLKNSDSSFAGSVHGKVKVRTDLPYGKRPVDLNFYGFFL